LPIRCFWKTKELDERQVDLLHVRVGGRRDHGATALANQRQQLSHMLARHEAAGENGCVGHHTPRQVTDERHRLLHRGNGVGGTELQRRLALELHRVDCHDRARSGDVGTLDGADPQPTCTCYHHRFARQHCGQVDGGSPSGRDAAADERSDVKRQVVVDLDGRGFVTHHVGAERAQQ